ncbi:ribosome biogenesis protein Sqt1 [Sodiomyces alkalinus F11]|uniref:Ribosome biogenesis protein Sqt1 n=1 Tax=Sodiomyces alkalinus (strain CBS 110278 / VKM F-3762 / F11) TaxID=1314773 RepID=A0A3N2Q2M8_SODAK|nr:ribosome biogenesis protein Sqt1 [Sodiomyces alkalinus F11]ROT41013.1 ribosome biogenesis protein Sqt1 [Sodiomyces alkalinus F11]
MSARRDEHEAEDQSEVLNADDVGEEIPMNDDEGDVAMDSDTEELIFQNDSIAFFDGHADSVFSIAQHPVYPSLIATGGSEGEADDAPGKGYVIDTSAAPDRPVLPSSYSGADPTKTTELDALFTIEGHTDSINALTFTLPRGDFLVSAGLDGRLRAYTVTLSAAQNPSQASNQPAATLSFLAEAQEVPEINWIAPCPSPEYPNTVALGASDNSVWVYTIDPAADPQNPLQVVNSYWLHTAPCTAGAWTPDGALLATVAEDSSLYAWDVWGLGAARGVVESNGQTVVSLTGEDQRFEVEGGLYSVAVEPNGTYLAVGGAEGHIRIVSLPRLGGGGGGGGGKASASSSSSSSSQQVSAGGQILASLKTQSESIETLSFVSPSGGLPNQQTTLLAAGSVDGSIAVYDATRRFAVRRNIAGAHEDHSVVKVEFIPGTWLLTSCGMDGVVRRWDLRGGSSNAAAARQNPPAAAGGAAPGPTASDAGLVKEWKGHRGDGEGGGVLGFVQGSTGERVITAGDDGVVLVFEA